MAPSSKTARFSGKSVAALNDGLNNQEPKRHADREMREIDVGPAGQNHAIVKRADGEDEDAGADHDPERAEHGRTVVEQDFKPRRIEPEAVGFGALVEILKQELPFEARRWPRNFDRRLGRGLRRKGYLFHLRQRLEPSFLPNRRSTTGARFRRFVDEFSLSRREARLAARSLPACRLYTVRMQNGQAIIPSRL